MDLSPNDIRGYEFPNQMRGYDKDEVDNFLEQVANALDETKQQNLKYSMEIESLKSQLAGLTQFEDTIKSAAIDARRNADATIATAKQEAEMLVSKARQDAENVTSVRTEEVEQLEKQITKLGLAKKSYFGKVRSLIQSHLEMIEDISTGDVEDIPDIDLPELASITAKDDIDVTESTDVTTYSRESLANEPTEEEAVESSTAAESNAQDSEEASVHPPEPETEKSIDPELAAALENYKQNAAEGQPTETVAPAAPAAPTAADPQNTVVETTARAEDIPPGFIAKVAENPLDMNATDKVAAENNQATSGEPNSLNIDGDKAPLEPEELVNELNEVATKIEEEIREAEATQ